MSFSNVFQHFGVLKIIINLFVENKNVFSTIRLLNYYEKDKEWVISVLYGFDKGIGTSKKSMIPMEANGKKWMKLLSGEKDLNFLTLTFL